MNTHAFAGLVVLAAAMCAQEQPAAAARKPDARIAAVLRGYDFQTWPQGAVRPGLPLSRVELPGLRGGDCDFAPPAPWVRRYTDSKGTPVVMVEAVVADDAAGAHARLGEWLASRTNPAPAPTCKTVGVEAGDIGFVGESVAPRIAWIAFARGNVAVRVVCLDPRADPHPDLPAAARAVDQAILAVPALAKNAVLPRPAIARIQPDRAACRVGDLVVLDVEARDPAGGQAQLQFAVGGTGQGYVEDDAFGRHVLHTTGAGAIELTVQALGTLGTAATATTRIEVAAH